MQNKLFLLIIALSVNHSFAQKFGRQNSVGNIYNSSSKSSFVNISLKSKDPVVVKDYLLKNSINLHHAGADLVIDFQTESPGGYHYTYQQTYHSLPVYNATIKANLDKKMTIRSITNELVNLSNVDYLAMRKDLEILEAEDFIKNFLSKKFNHPVEYQNQISVCVLAENEVRAVQKITYRDAITGLNELLLVNCKEEIVYERDLKRYYSAAISDTTIAVKVFKPDPITSAHTTNTGSYVDNNDADNVSLTGQRVSAQVKATFNAGKFTLENSYAKILDFDSPTVAVANSTTPNFDFTRSASGFEDVNVFYHVTTMQLYLRSLGYTNLMDMKLNIDTHGEAGADNSHFSGSGWSNQPELVFGEGGVDDGEDADVIVHEYGHAVSWSANKNNYNSNDRGALDEAFGDYQAATYSRAIDTYAWADIFNWDGHNAYWPGRNANSTKKYPSGLVNQIHSDGEIWSSVMMEIWGVLGKTTTDKLMYESLYMWTNNMTMPNAASWVIHADTLLNYGANYDVLCAKFKARGLYSGNCAIGIEDFSGNNLIQLINSKGFMEGTGNLFLLMPDIEKSVGIEVFDLSGRKVYQAVIENNNKIMLNPAQFEKGVYIITVKIDNRIYSNKIMRMND